MKTLAVIALFLFATTLAVGAGSSFVVWFASTSDAAGLWAIGCTFALIVLGAAAIIAYYRPGVDPFAGMDSRAGPELDPEAEAENHLAPLRHGGTQTARRMIQRLRSEGRLTRPASRSRARRAEAGVQVEAPEPGMPAGAAHMPVPEPVTRPVSAPPASFAEPEPGTAYQADSTMWTTTVALYGEEAE